MPKTDANKRLAVAAEFICNLSYYYNFLIIMRSAQHTCKKRLSATAQFMCNLSHYYFILIIIYC